MFQPRRPTGPAWYCSDPCRKNGSERNRRAAVLRRSRRRSRSAGPKKCRVCSKAFAAGGGGNAPASAVYCSPACRAEGERAYRLEYQRRRRSGPENRAVRAARARATRARRRPVLRPKCKECGRSFETANSVVRYCSDRCRKKAYSNDYAAPLAPPARARRGMPRAKCRVCSREFVAGRGSGGGPGRKRAYCSPACYAEGKLAYMRGYTRPSRRGSSSDGSGGSGSRGRSATGPGRGGGRGRGGRP